MSFKKLLAFSCAAVLFSNPSFSADNTIVVTATKNSVKIAKTPSKVDIITSKQLKDKGIIYVKNALKEIVGISVNSTGAFGGTTSVNMRGLPNYYTKVLIDGVDVSDSSLMQPSYNFASLTVDDIEKIEIVQGAQSGLYGSNAVGGVINIITKKGGGKPYLKYTQTFGSFGTYKETAQAGGSINRFAFYLEASRFDTNGISKMDKLNKNGTYSKGDEKDAYHKTAASGRIEYTFDDDLKVGEVVKWFSTKDYLDNGWSKTYSPDDLSDSNKDLREKTDFFLSKLYLIKTFKNLTTNFDIFYTQTSRHNKSAPPSWADYKGKRLGTNINALYQINNTKITFGGSMIKETYKDNTPFKKTRNNAALFLEVEHNINNLSIQAVARQDWFTTFGNHFTYKLGANYLVDKTGTILKINYSTGFRAPSIYELYAKPISKWGFLGGNRNLNPETAKTWDFGFLQGFQNNKITFSAAYFKSIIKDKIAYTTNTATWESTYQNTPGKTVAYGIELSIKAKPAKNIEFGANYTYTKSTNPQTGKQSARIPYRVYTGYITFKTLDNKILATLDGRYIGTKYDDAGHMHQIGKYALFDFTTVYKPTKNIEATLSIKNIFDRFYEEVYGYSTLPRSVFVGMSYKF